MRSTIRYQLNCLDRNIKGINLMLDMLEEIPLKHKILREFCIIQTLKDQQRKMYDEKTSRYPDRIVSISQSYARPIVSGETVKKVEFG